MHIRSKNICLNMIILLGILYFLMGVKYAAADSRTNQLKADIIIQSLTEDEIITKTGTYAVIPSVRIYNHFGKIMGLQNVTTPCVARITYEASTGNTLPQISEIREIKVLPDMDLRKHRKVIHPE